MKRNIHLLWILLIGTLFSSCQYELAEDFYNNIELQEPTVSLSLINFTEGETLTTPRNINYSYNAPLKNSLYEMKFYINGSLIHTTSKSSGSFLLDIQKLNNGEHNLNIEYYFKTGSGSLAEISGEEAFLKKEKFNFLVDKAPKILEIDKIEHKEGSIFIYFKPYFLINEIGKSITATLNVEEVKNTSSFYRNIILTKEVLEKGIYKDIKASNLNLKYKTKIENNFQSVDSEVKEINIPNTFKFNANFIKGNKLKLTWTKYPLYNNVPFFNFTYLSASYNFYDGEKNLTTIGGEKIIDNPNVAFGKAFDYRLHFPNAGISPIDDFIYSGKYFFNTPIHTGSPSTFPDTVKKILYDKSTDKIYLLKIEQDNYYPIEDEVYIQQYNSTNLNLERSVLISKTKGSQGDLILNSEGDLILDLNEKSLVINTNSLSVKKQFNGEDYNTITQASLVRYRNNIVIIESLDDSWGKIHFHNSDTKKLFYSTDADNQFSLSNSAKYFSKRHSIYIRKGDTYVEFFDTGLLNFKIVFNENKNEMYVPISGGEFFILDANTKQKRTIKNLPQIYNVKYDPIYNTLLLKKTYNNSIDDLYFFNMDTQELKSIKTIREADYYLLNNNLISKRGFYLKNDF
ncbi:hypothetical protein F7018_15895 [Tenacibaculum aiptasiae]|uniref:Uncharacterized protein n=1 Tax=Tenacibaculum aiptasiae TaxID=426481 RepID=A0A7J5A8V2_9FLAO|nr:hypothetical protein [Tenacibaculum aiptasiae]KAB1153965.1 hypothetical protein F7018_15895 [Tenacibaculum aiptasiae]